MDPQIYDEIIEFEHTHWWYLARRSVMQSLLNRLPLNKPAIILEAGCGSGGNFSILAPLGDIYAFEMSEKMRSHAKARQMAQVEDGMLPQAIPYAGTNFDLICLFDVLEHVQDDGAALKELAARLNPGGTLFINVPAYQWLFMLHDRLHHHFRRYSKHELLSKIQAAGLQVEFVSHWNFFLFPVAMVVRLIDCLKPSKSHAIGSQKPADFINKFLFTLVSSERFLLRFMRLPFGLSLVVVAKKAV